MIKIEEIEITNYRSIISETLHITPKNYNIIVGPNNCGKSNILRALDLFFNDHPTFNNETDVPKFDGLDRANSTKILLEFSYDPTKERKIDSSLAEMEANSKQIRLDDNRIRIRLVYTKTGLKKWQFIGKSGSRNVKDEYIEKIVDSVRSSIRFKYIPVGRDVSKVISEELSQELVRTVFSGWSGSAVKVRQEINDAVSQLIAKLQTPLNQTSQDISLSMNKTFQEIKKLQLVLPFTDLDTLIKYLVPIVEDKYNTDISSKGAGIQTSSLLFFLKYLADNHPQRNNAFVTFIWAIEEPESFLHPKQQRGVSEILKGFSQEVQTFITTHSPSFIHRNTNINLLVINKKEHSPYTTYVVSNDYNDVKESLGVSLIDSMYLSKLNICVEGISDKIILEGILEKMNKSGIIDDRYEEIEIISGNNCVAACNLFESLQAFSTDSTINNMVILDGDDAGRKALTGLIKRMKANSHNLVEDHDYIILESYTEALISNRIKEVLIAERPSQIIYTRNIKKEITHFTIQDGYKKKVAIRIVELLDQDDIDNFSRVTSIILDRMGKIPC